MRPDRQSIARPESENTTARPDSAGLPVQANIRARVLIPLAILTVGLILAAGLVLFADARTLIDHRCDDDFGRVSAAFETALAKDATVMGAALDVMARGGALLTAFRARDKEALLERAEPLFQQLRAEHRITHFYFHDPNRVCVLRVHQPDRHGDKIERFTALAAQETDKTAWGIELGPLGTFTLRVVRPWYDGDQLVGYLEMGEEVDHVISQLRASMGMEFVVSVQKEFLDRDRWEEGMRMLGREADWDLTRSSVISDTTLTQIPRGIAKYLTEGRHRHNDQPLALTIGGRQRRAAFQRLTDAGQREVGDLVSLRDVTDEYRGVLGTVARISLVNTAVGTMVLVFFYFFLGRVQSGLAAKSMAVAQSERFLQTVIDAIPDPVSVIDLDHRIVLANAAARKLAGDTDPVAGGMTSHQLFRRSDRPCSDRSDPCPLAQVVSANAPVATTHTHYGDNGEPNVIEISAAPIFDEAGQVAQVIAMSRDVTARKQADRKLRRLAMISEQTSEGIVVLGLDGIVQFANAAWATMHGYESPDELPGNHINIFRADADWGSEVVPEMEEDWDDGTYRGEINHLRKGGGEFPAEVVWNLLKDENRQPVGVISLAKDITDRKRAQRRIEHLNSLSKDLLRPASAEAKFKHVTDAIVEGFDADLVRIWIIKPGDHCESGCIHAHAGEDAHRCRQHDRCLHLVASSGRYTHIDGKVHGRVPFDCYNVGRVASGAEGGFITNDVTHDPCVHDHEWAEEMGLVSFAGYQLTSPRGAPIGVLAVFSKHAIDAEEGAALGSVADTTAQVVLTESTREALVQAEVANQAKSAFLANMSHEIRTPMTAIIGFTEQMKDPAASASDRDNYRAIIERNSRHLLDLINDILDLSRIEAGKLTVEQTRYSPASLAAEAAATMRSRAEDKGVSLSVKHIGELPETILTDPTRLRQALVNLVGNAVKFTERGEVRIELAFLPQWRDQQSAIRIQVVDTGIGIADDKLEQLFDPFVQADVSTSRKYGGTGLGLTITRHMAQLLDGTLTVESTPDVGSTFTLTVPTGDLEGVRLLNTTAETFANESGLTAGQTHEPKALAGLRILLAEDGPDNQLLIGTVLRRAGAEVELADNGRIAVEKAIAGDQFDIILMDMQMPEMDGYAATKALRRQGLTCPIIALTAHAMTGDRDKCHAAGCSAYCTKPIDRARLIATIGQHAARHAAATVERQAMDRPPETSGDDTLRSEYADDPDMIEIIGEFVANLTDRTDAMRQALANSDHQRLQELAHQLKGAGGGYGYPTLTETAKALEYAARDEEFEAAQLALHELDKLCQAVVAGHNDQTVPASTNSADTGADENEVKHQDRR